MFDKYAKVGADSTFFAPSIKELQYAQTNSKGLANALMAVLGISAAGYSAKRLLEGVASSRLSQDIQPSLSIQKRLRSAVSPIENEFLYNEDELQHPFDAEEAAELKKRLKELEKEEKKASVIEINPSVFGKETTKLKQDPIASAISNRRKATFVGDLVKDIDANKVLAHSDTTLSDRIKYDPSTMSTKSLWTKYISGPLAKMGPQSAIPLKLIGGAGLVAAPMLAKSLVSHIAGILPKPKRESKFVEDAKEIYEDAARELQEVGYKKEKDKDKKKKEAGYKYAADKHTIVEVTNNGGNPLLSASNLPTLALASLLGYATFKGMSGIDKGLEKAKKDLSHQTQLLRGWRATNASRDYSYNPFTAELEEEPGLKTRTMKEKNKRIKELLEDLKDSDEIEVNPLEVQRLSADYAKLA